MPGRLPYIKRRKYPHMFGEDVILWNRFIDRYPGRFISVDYDFRVGEGIPMDPDWEKNFKRMAKMITQKRIDVVGWVDDQPTIIEVKKRVGLSTLGQVLGYKLLFTTDLPNIKIPLLLVITEMIFDDDLLILKKYKIPVVVV